MLDLGWSDTPTTDRRSAIRRRVRRKARVVTNAGWSTFDANVISLSIDGAALEFDGFVPLPEYFELRYDHVKKHVRRCWQDGRRAGVAFESN